MGQWTTDTRRHPIRSAKNRPTAILSPSIRQIGSQSDGNGLLDRPIEKSQLCLCPFRYPVIHLQRGEIRQIRLERFHSIWKGPKGICYTVFIQMFLFSLYINIVIVCFLYMFIYTNNVYCRRWDVIVMGIVWPTALRCTECRWISDCVLSYLVKNCSFHFALCFFFFFLAVIAHCNWSVISNVWCKRYYVFYDETWYYFFIYGFPISKPRGCKSLYVLQWPARLVLPLPPPINFLDSALESSSA